MILYSRYGWFRNVSAVMLCIGMFVYSRTSAAEESASPSTPPATAPSASIVPGGLAPKLAGKFIQGDAITDYKPGKVYIVEFWATWCVPCRGAIPHINDLYNKYKDKGVVVVGQSVWENKPEDAPAFVKKMGDGMSYPIAVDQTEGEPEVSKGVMARTWLAAAGLNGIPSTWIVKDGKVLWIGHPMDLDELKIEAARAGTFDILAGKLKNQQKSEKQQKQMAVQQQFWDAIHDRDAAAADAVLEAMKEFYPDRPDYRRGFQVRAAVVFQRFDEALKIARTYPDNIADPKRAFSQRMQAVQDLIITNPKDASFLKEVVALLDEAKIPDFENTTGGEIAVLRLRAWITFLQGDQQTAINLDEQAISLMGDSPFKTLEVRILEGYRAGRAPELAPKHSAKKSPATQPAT